MDDHNMPAEGAAKAVMDRARAAWERIKTDDAWHTWLAIGEGLVWCRREGMRRAHTDDTKANRYRTAMGAILAEEKLDTIDKGVRSHLLDVMDALPDIERWRSTLTVNERARWNHPRTVLEHWKRATAVAKPKPEGPTPRQNLQDQVIRLQEELDAVRKRGGGGLLPSATPDELADMISDAQSTVFRRKLIAVLIKRTEADERQDKIERDRKRQGTKAKPPRDPRVAEVMAEIRRQGEEPLDEWAQRALTPTRS